MTKERTQYSDLGLIFIAGGTLFGLVSWLVIDYVPLTALAVAGIIMGTISWVLSKTLPSVSVDAGRVLLNAGLDNIASLIEELGLSRRAIYLPSSVAGGKALIPLHGNFSVSRIPPRIEQRLIVKLGQTDESIGLLVSTPGSFVLPKQAFLENPTTADLERIINSIVVGDLGLAGKVKLTRSQESILLEIINTSLHVPRHAAHDVLGSPIASIAAAVAAEILSMPVMVETEIEGGKHDSIALRILEGTNQ